MNYADLQVTTHFSFLRGVSSAEELFSAAAALGIKALGIVDRNSLAGMVRAHEAAKVTGVRLIVGCRLDLQCGTSLLVYPTDRTAYGASMPAADGRQTRAGKGACHIDWPDVEEWNEGLLAILLPDELKNDLAGRTCKGCTASLATGPIARSPAAFCPTKRARLQEIAMPAATGARCRRSPRMTFSITCPTRRMLQDVVTCIRLHTTIDNAGFQKERHADRFLKAPDEMLRLFPKYEHAVRRTWEIAERCKFSLDQLTYTYPTEELEDGLNAQERLEKLTWEGAAQRYPEGLPDNVATQLRHELNLIERMDYAPYFLDGRIHRPLCALARKFSVRAAARPRIRPSVTCSASPRSIPFARGFCSSASSAKSAASRPISTSISSTSGARKSSSGFTRPMAARSRHNSRLCRPRVATLRASRLNAWPRIWRRVLRALLFCCDLL